MSSNNIKPADELNAPQREDKNAPRMIWCSVCTDESVSYPINDTGMFECDECGTTNYTHDD